jgi:hypothetical protein
VYDILYATSFVRDDVIEIPSLNILKNKLRLISERCQRPLYAFKCVQCCAVLRDNLVVCVVAGTFRLGSNNIAALDASMVDVYKYAQARTYSQYTIELDNAHIVPQAVLIMVNPFSPTAEQYVRVALEDVPLSVCVCVLINFRDCLETSYLQIPGAPQPRISKSQVV